MKFKLPVFVAILGVSLFSSGVFADERCRHGGQCQNESEIFQEALRASQASSCNGLTAFGARQVADLGFSGSIDAGSFNRAYAMTCNFGSSLSAARSSYEADAYISAFQSARHSGCSNLTPSGALSVAEAAVNNGLSVDGFNAAYRTTCDYNSSFSAAENKFKAQAYVDAFESARNSGCSNLTGNGALSVASAANHRELDVAGFNQAYRASCDYNSSFAAASDARKAQAFVDAFRSARSSSCSNLTGSGALTVADAADRGELDVKAFNEAYKASCNYEDSLAVSRCRRVGSLLQSVSPHASRDRRESNSTSVRHLAQLTGGTPAVPAAGNSSAAME